MIDTYRHRGTALVLGAALLWGTTGTARALGPSGADSLSVGSVRLVIGAAGLVLVAGVLGRLRPTSSLPITTLALTAAGVAAYQPLFFTGVARSGVALGTIVAIGSGPVFTGGIAAVVDGWRPDRRWLVATFLAVGGVGLIAGRPAGADPGGILAAAGAGLSYAVYAVGSKRLLRHLPPLGAMAWAFGGGALLLLPVAIAAPAPWLGTRTGIGLALWLGLATVTLAYVLFGYGLRRVEVSRVATLSLGEPLTAAVLGLAILGERPDAAGVTGALLVLAGLAVVSLPRPAPAGS